jgi:hypothetical protein
MPYYSCPSCHERKYTESVGSPHTNSECADCFLRSLPVETDEEAAASPACRICGAPVLVPSPMPFGQETCCDDHRRRLFHKVSFLKILNQDDFRAL